MKILEQQQPTKSDIFISDVKNLYGFVLSRHTSLMNVWNEENPLEVIQGLDTDALTSFQASSLFQQILKLANPDYEIISPYIWKNVTKTITNEEGEEIEITEREKVLVKPIFNDDGSIKELEEVTS